MFLLCPGFNKHLFQHQRTDTLGNVFSLLVLLVQIWLTSPALSGVPAQQHFSRWQTRGHMWCDSVLEQQSCYSITLSTQVAEYLNGMVQLEYDEFHSIYKILETRLPYTMEHYQILQFETGHTSVLVVGLSRQCRCNRKTSVYALWNKYQPLLGTSFLQSPHATVSRVRLANTMDLAELWEDLVDIA